MVFSGWLLLDAQSCVIENQASKVIKDHNSLSPEGVEGGGGVCIFFRGNRGRISRYQQFLRRTRILNKRVVNLSLAAYILLLFIGITIGAVIYLYFF